MATAVAFTVAPLLSSPFKSPRIIGAAYSSSSLTPPLISSSSSSSSFNAKFPSQSLSATKYRNHRHGCFVVACLPSSPEQRTAEVSTKLYVSGLTNCMSKGVPFLVSFILAPFVWICTSPAMEDFYWVSMLSFLILAGFWSFIYVLQSKLTKSSNPQPPGPLGLPIFGHLLMLGVHPHRSLHKLSQKYGPIMLLKLGAIPTVIVSSVETAEFILRKHDHRAHRAKAQYSDYVSYGSRGLVFSEYGPYWRNLRKLCNMHLLSSAKIESYKPLRSEEVSNLVKILKQAGERHEVVNINEQLGLVMEKVIYGMLFGTRSKERYNIKPYVEEAMYLLGAPNFAEFLPFLRRFDIQGLKRRMKSVSKNMDDILEKIMDEHERDNIGLDDHPRDFMDVMLSLLKSSNTQEEKLERVDIKALALEMLEGGADPSVTTIEWALTELLRNPQVMKHVQRELVNVIGMERMVEEVDLVKLSYLNMVVKETMRLHPSSPLIFRKTDDDISINGYHIPKESTIFVNSWALGRDPNVWSNNAEEFYPERFANVDIDVRGQNIQLIPFGSGRRKCPGSELGIRTVQFVLAQLVHCFNFELPNGMSPSDIEIKEVFGTSVRKANPLLVIPNFRLQIKNT